MAATKTPALKRELGGWTTTAVVIGNMIGSGVFLLPAALAVVALEYGSGSLLAWVVTGVGAMLLAGVFASLGRAYPKTGGPYVYVRRAFGDTIEELDTRAVIEALSETSPNLVAPADGSGRAQLWPHRHNTDAMSISLLRRV